MTKAVETKSETITIGPTTWKKAFFIFRRMFESLSRKGKDEAWAEFERMAEIADLASEALQALHNLEVDLAERDGGRYDPPGFKNEARVAARAVLEKARAGVR